MYLTIYFIKSFVYALKGVAESINILVSSFENIALVSSVAGDSFSD